MIAIIVTTILWVGLFTGLLYGMNKIIKEIK